LAKIFTHASSEMFFDVPSGFVVVALSQATSGAPAPKYSFASVVRTRSVVGAILMQTPHSSIVLQFGAAAALGHQFTFAGFVAGPPPPDEPLLDEQENAQATQAKRINGAPARATERIIGDLEGMGDEAST
jgi:hypothetical protein